MGHSRAEKAESRERILLNASRQIRESGLESVAIADLMQSAGLTHGAFYGHFASRSALLAAALEKALRDGEKASIKAAGVSGPLTLKSIVNGYLSPAHRDSAAGGCAVSALAAEVARADSEVAAIMREAVERFIDSTSEVIGNGPSARSVAISSWCTMVGALALSRLFQGDALSDEILKEARAAVLDREQQMVEKP
jgi:TetR/AcrR family transcriptional repressor of nem operon